MAATAIVLAAGLGTRMKSELVKVLHTVAGRPMINYVVSALRASGVSRIVVVIGHQAARVKESLGGSGVEFVVQEPQLGTGHAVMQARDKLESATGEVIVTYGDVPLIRPESFLEMLKVLRADGSSAVMLTAVPVDPTGYGRVVRDPSSGEVSRVVEQRDATPEEALIKEVNSGTYCFKVPPLLSALAEVRSENTQGEFYLTDVIELLSRQGHRVASVSLEDPEEGLGVNDRIQLAGAEARIRERVRTRLMLSGVTLMDPSSTFVDEDVVVGQDATILPFTLIEGRSSIGTGCTIGPAAVIRDSVVGNGAVVFQSTVNGGTIAQGARIGPFRFIAGASGNGRR